MPFTQNADAWLDIILWISKLAYIFICAICLDALYMRLFGRQSVKRMAFIRLPAVAYFIVLLICYFIPAELNAFFAYAVSVAASFITSLFIFKPNLPLKVYAAVLFLALQYTVFAITTNIALGILDVHENNVLSVIDNGETVGGEFIFYTLLEVFNRAIQFLLLYFSVKIIGNRLDGSRIKLSAHESALLILSAAAPLISFYLLTARQSYTREQPYLWLTCLAGTVSLACIIGFAVLFNRLLKNKELELENALLNGAIGDMEKNYAANLQASETSRAAMHDYKNHLSVLQSLAKDGEYNELSKYLEDMSGAANVRTVHSNIDVKNAVVNSVLRNKASLCEKLGIELNIKADEAPELINPFTLSVILNNALDNAIRATKEYGEKWINVIMSKRGAFYVIKIENPYGNRIILKDGLPVLKDGAKGGYGLKNIRSAVASLNGAMDIELNNNVFCLTALLSGN